MMTVRTPIAETLQRCASFFAANAMLFKHTLLALFISRERSKFK